MPADAARSTCRACGSTQVVVVPVIHHMACAYVGPEYDFDREGEGYRCPKCHRELADEAQDWEVVGSSARCSRCSAEFLVPGTPADCA